MRVRLRPSPLAVAMTAFVVALGVTGTVVTAHVVDRQDATLLRDDTAQGVDYLSSIIGQVESGLLAMGAVATYSDDPAAFVSKAHQVASGITAAVLRRTGDGYVVSAAETGPLLAPGQVIDPAQAEAIASAGATVVATPVVQRGAQTQVGFALGPPATPPGTAVYEVALEPHYLPPGAVQGFSELAVALYAAPHPRSDALVLATTRELPVTGTTVHQQFRVGASTWVLVASARHPLSGTLAHAIPWLILGLAVLIGVGTGLVVELLARRNRFATAVVERRTAELQRTVRTLQEAQRALVQSERLAAVGEMASVIGHELRNPLGAVMNALFLVRNGLDDAHAAALDRHLSLAERETEKAATLVDDLRNFVRPRAPQHETVAVAEVLQEVLQATPAPAGVDVQTDVEGVTLAADRHQLAEVLTNLVSNAYEAMADGGILRVSACIEADEVYITVQDTGPGIAGEALERIFEPFFTTKPSGTGLGLAVVRRIVDAHGGDVRVDSTPGAGTSAQVVLPARVAVGAR